ncbi:hypothetical protein JGS22_024910 [Streptomyces sp. P38-E01]|uniref:Uncharacterized protein n=1 Tax=Streptomyces tardus TaxID=2780544 RepID=A0A949JIH6_9ACTN|nr:hypothetical protein [Streptomyces tardus]MBU7600776.1 hypothetical protein [Streptomyces tardus]
MGTEPRDQGDDESSGGAGGRGDSADWDDLVLDENFIRGAEVSEPAARTRMLQERWRNQPPEPQPWRADEPPAGWFFSKSRRKARKTRGRRRWRRRKDED